MNNKISHDSHVNTINARFNEFISKSEKISRELEMLLKDLESFDHTFCRTSLGKELNVKGNLKLDNFKNILGSSCANIKKFALGKRKISLAFDNRDDLSDSRKTGHS